MKVGGHPGQSEAILGGLDLEVGISQNGRHSSQKHGANESRHQRNALRHNEHNAIADGNTVVLEQQGLHSRHPAKVAKGGRLLLVFIDPCGYKRPLRRCRQQRVNQGSIFCCDWQSASAFRQTGFPRAYLAEGQSRIVMGLWPEQVRSMRSSWQRPPARRNSFRSRAFPDLRWKIVAGLSDYTENYREENLPINRS